MARKRMIDPKIWDSCYDKNLTSMDFAVLIAAISSADDEGRGKISMIERALGKMLNEKQFKSSLSNLSDTIKIYNDIYYYLPNWTEYQLINRPKPSKLPLPPSNGTHTNHGTITDESRINHGLITDESLTHHEKSFAIRSRIRKEVEVEKEIKEKEPQPQLQAIKLFAIWGRAPDGAEKSRTENLLKQHGYEAVWKAFHRASEMGKEKKNVAYVRGILTNPDKQNDDRYSKRIGG